MRIVIAGRNPPETGWRHGGWDALLVELELQPLPDADAADLLRRRGVDDEAIAPIVRWAGGLPLALAVAADATQTLDLSSEDDLDRQLGSVLLRDLVGDELAGRDHDIIAVASVLPRVDARMLAAVLPGVDADRADAWLRALSFAEPSGPWIALHERARQALRGELRRRAPDVERDLRRRVADHLHDRAMLGEPWLLFELPLLIDDEAVRWGLGAEPTDLVVDELRPGDVETLAAAVSPDREAWFEGLERWLRDAPDHVVVVRQGNALAGLGVVATVEWAPAWVDEDVVVGPWRRHAREHVPGGNAFLLRDSFDLITPPGAPSAVIARGNNELVTRCGLRNPRGGYIMSMTDEPAQQAFIEAMGFVRMPELSVDDHGRRRETFMMDHGPGGLIGGVRALVYRDLGLPPPTSIPVEVITAEKVRDLLRSYHDPLALAGSPLARGGTTAERAESARRVVGQALDGAFGSSEDEQLQRTLLERGYLDDDGGHARAARDLHLSRTTYYRRLALAADRLARHVVEARTGPIRD